MEVLRYSFASAGRVQYPRPSKFTRSAGLTPLLVSYVQIQKAPYHLLILGAVLFGFLLKKVNGRLAQSDSDFDLFLIKCQPARGRKKIINYSHIAQWLIGVFCFLFHKYSFPFANIRLRGSESSPYDM